MIFPQPHLTPVADSGDDRYEVAAAFSWAWYAEGASWRITVPQGFRCDGASVPWIGTVLTGIGRDGLHRAAALIHDFLYRYAGKLPHGSFCKNTGNGWQPCPVAWTRKQSDQLFANMLAAYGVSKLRRRTMYLAVRAAGWRSWKNPN
jgi:hypothetical protein